MRNLPLPPLYKEGSLLRETVIASGEALRYYGAHRETFKR